MSARSKKNLGAVGITALITAGLAVAGWLGMTVYNNLDSRVSAAQTTADSTQNALIHETSLLVVIAQKQGIPPTEINQLLGQ